MTTNAVSHVPLTRSVAADHPALRKIHAELCSLGFASLPEAVSGPLVELQYAARADQYRASFPNALYELITVDGSDVGQLISAVGPDALHLVDISVRLDWQDRGVGTEVLGKLIDRADELGLPVTLSVWGENVGARRLYQRIGFTDSPESTGYLTLRRDPSAGATP